MIIDLNELKKVDEIIITGNIEFSPELYKTSEILNLKDFHFAGKLSYNNIDELVLEGNLVGIMTLPDSITLEEISLPLKLDIEEIIEEFENTLDISLILWQNIVLEIPIRITKNETPTKISGEGWSLQEETKEIYDERLAPLRELLEEKE